MTIDIKIINAAKNGDQAAKLSICKTMIPFIKKLSGYIPGEWKDDAMQSGYLAVLIAITKFDPSRSENFSFFASQFIQSEIAELYNTCLGICRVPRKVMIAYNDEKKKHTPNILPNGMRVDDIDRLFDYTGLHNAE